jgi:hypothetical protein
MGDYIPYSDFPLEPKIGSTFYEQLGWRHPTEDERRKYQGVYRVELFYEFTLEDVDGYGLHWKRTK